MRETTHSAACETGVPAPSYSNYMQSPAYPLWNINIENLMSAGSVEDKDDNWVFCELGMKPKWLLTAM